MKFWSLAFVVAFLAGAAATKATNASHELAEVGAHSGVPVTTLHTPVTP
ncbi:hypothetical protein [Roseibium aggregatum]|uniref:Uncharacterized protein n=1 Tax=Roseibium aggregatum TaxID=187304 RepID=A0A939EJ86_9HYPH|nr:hypothetical protein [Roseibium aggregatum]MBN9673313.1 hypothetical protein [Roseibium aggregatum]